MGASPAVDEDLPVEAIRALARLVELGDLLVLTGAGISTDSGIPDYRGSTGSRRHSAPMTWQTFVVDADARQRYWARSFVGWPRIGQAQPNSGHRSVASLQSAGCLRALVTQNVDGLHQAAGAQSVIELHGGLDRTVCLHCGDVASRAELHERLRELNPNFRPPSDQLRPDGDIVLSDEQVASFVMAECLACGRGPLKPDVVFFGETVPRERVTLTYELLEQSRALVVLGSSLTVMSGYRFVLRAEKLGIPIAIVTLGPSRGDAKAILRIDAPLGAVLPRLVQLMSR